MIKNCLVCHKEFRTYLSRVKVDKGKYCSKKCCFKALKGKPSPLKGIKLTKEQRDKLNLKGLELGRVFWKGKKRLDMIGHTWNKGRVPWNKKLKGFGKWVKWLPKDEINPAWKGDEVGYIALHDWVKGKLGTPLECSICGKKSDNSRMFHWHNISTNYLRNLSDWLRVCAKCHKKIHKKI